VRRAASPKSPVNGRPRSRSPSLWPLAADAIAAEAADSGAIAPTGTAASPGGLSYRVTVDAPSPLKETLLRDVGLVRWQDYAEMTDDLLERLAREAIDETRGMAAAEGYFSARIDVKIDRAADPVAVTLIVDPGAPTRIATVRIVVAGPAADAPLGTEAIARLTREWGLPEGDMFRQAAWSIARARAGHTRGQPTRRRA
jgi:translocation and assembly module TamA